VDLQVRRHIHTTRQKRGGEGVPFLVDLSVAGWRRLRAARERLGFDRERLGPARETPGFDHERFGPDRERVGFDRERLMQGGVVCGTLR